MNHTKVTLFPTCLTQMLTAMGSPICRKSLALANALRKLQIGIREVPMPESSPATSHMFIVNPLSADALRVFSQAILPRRNASPACKR